MYGLKSFLIVLLVFVAIKAQGQTSTKDSLILLLDEQRGWDSTRVLRLCALNDILGKNESYADLMLQRAEEAYEIAQKINFQRGIALSAFRLGKLYGKKDDQSKAINLLQTAMNHWRTVGSPKELADIYLEISFNYQKRGEYERAVAYTLKTFEIYEALKDENGLGEAYNQAGILYRRIKEWDNSIAYHQKALEKRRTTKNKINIASSLNNIAVGYRNKKMYDTALMYHHQSLTLKQEINDEKGIAISYNNLGEVYREKKEFAQAIEYYLKSLAIKEKLKDKPGIVLSQNNLAATYIEVKEYEKARQLLNKALPQAIILSLKEQEMESYLYLSLLAEKEGNSLESLAFFKQHTNLKDSIYDKEKSLQIAQMQAIYESDKKDKEIVLLNATKTLQTTEIEAQNFRQWFFGGGILSLILLIGALIHNISLKQKSNKLLAVQKNEVMQANTELHEKNETVKQMNEKLHSTLEKVEKQKMEIEKQNDDITGSILYAQRIQTAMLPFEDRFEASLGIGNFFIFYKPRNIVSGDFYWFLERDNRVFFIVADCTGHGVPGALMSMIGNQLLHEIIVEKEIYLPNEILQALTVEVRRVLKQDKTDNRDGMDIAVCVWQENEKMLYYSGAMNPLYMVQNNEFREIKATKRSIGGTRVEWDKEHEFILHQIPIDQTTTIYLSSDGFQDQFGGTDKRKFMTQSFKKLLFSMHHKPMADQQKMLKETLARFMEEGEQKQIDDVLVMGVKIVV